MAKKNDIDNFAPEKVLQDLLSMKEVIDVASEELRVKLNEVIERNHLSPLAVLASLAQLSAGFVHVMQSQCGNANDKDRQEQLFNDLFQTFLATFDYAEVEKIKNLKLN